MAIQAHLFFTFKRPRLWQRSKLLSDGRCFMRSTQSFRNSKIQSSLASRRAAINAAAMRCGMESLEARRLLSAGQLDPTFGNGGIVTDNTLPGASAVVVQSDGKVVEASQFLGHISVARFNADGSPDKSFGYFGRLTSDVAGVTKVADLALQSDGKIVIAFSEANGDFLLTRYNPNGSLDTTFNHTGVVTTDFGADEEATALTLTANGQIVAAGNSTISGRPFSQLALARYNPDGTLDATFGNNGEVLSGDVGHSYEISDVAVGPDQKVVVVGVLVGRFGMGESFLVLRFNPNGSADGTTFDLPPRVSQPPLGYNAVAIQSDGKIVAAGEPNAPLVRYNTNGTLDGSFGNAGEIDTVVGPNVSPVAFRDVLLQPDGKIVAAGSFSTPEPHNFFLARYQTNGTPDPTFGTNGSVVGDQLARIAMGPGGTIVAVGGSVSQLELARYTGDSTVVNTGASISGTVYNDANGNGVRDNGEAPIAGRKVYLDLYGIGVFATGDPIAATDANGAYSFTNLPSKNYLVRLVPQNGLVITMPLFGGKYFVQLGLNQAVTGDDFGTQAAGSPNFPLPGGQLLVAGSAPGGLFTLTRYNADGSTDVSFGHFGVVTLPGGVGGMPTNAQVQPNGQIVVNYAADLVTLSATGAILSIVPTASVGGSISGSVYNDANDNGVKDPTETAVAGRQVYLDIPGIGVYVAGDPVALTDAGGAYSFGGLAAGNYLVRLVPVAGQVISAPLFGGKFFVQLGANQHITGDDFGTLAAHSPNLTLPDGKLLVANPFDTSYTLTRYNPDGSTDTTFGTLGTLKLGASPAGGITQLLLRPDGNVVVSLAGFTPQSATYSLLLLDPSGAVLHDVVINFQFEGQQGNDTIEGVAIAPDNKTIVAYQHDDPAPTHYKFVRRYNADFTLDTSFGTNGQAIVTGAPIVPLTSVTPLASGQIVLNYGGTVLTLSSIGAVI